MDLIKPSDDLSQEILRIVKEGDIYKVHRIDDEKQIFDFETLEQFRIALGELVKDSKCIINDTGEDVDKFFEIRFDELKSSIQVTNEHIKHAIEKIEKIEKILPELRKVGDSFNWMLGTIESAPENSRWFFNSKLYENVSGSISGFNSDLTKLISWDNGEIERSSMIAALATTSVTGSLASISSVSVSDTNTQKWLSDSTASFQVYSVKYDLYKTVLDFINKYIPKCEKLFEESKIEYFNLKENKDRKAFATTARTFIEKSYGEFVSLVGNNRSQKKTWDDFVKEFLIPIDGSEYDLFMNLENSRKNLKSVLTDIFKENKSSTENEIQTLYNEYLNLYYSIFSNIKK
ncbi:MAG: hypothetical protein JST55_10585 [Bacteroidetes bacterium]|nr:hypothetical protein [Bacteroidota bacterium]